MALMSFPSRSHVKVSMGLMRADHLFIHNYIRSLLNNILRPFFIKLIIIVIIYNYNYNTIYGPDEARTRVLHIVHLTP